MKGKLCIILRRSLWVGTLITILSPFLPIYTVRELDQFSNLKFGFPFRFVTQQSSLTPFKENLPMKLHIQSPYENPTKIIFENFFLSLITIIGLVFFVYVCISLLQYKFKNS